MFNLKIRKINDCSIKILYRSVTYQNINEYRKIESKKSSLHVSKYSQNNRYSLFKNLIKQDFSFIKDLVKNLDDVNKNLIARKLPAIDTKLFKDEYLHISKKLEEINTLIEQKNEISLKVANLNRKTDKDMNSDSELKSLIINGQKLKEEIFYLEDKLEKNKENFYFSVLKLPNELNPKTPLETNEVLFKNEINQNIQTFQVPFNFNTKWSFQTNVSDITSQYRCGDYSKMEFILSEYISRKLKGFQNFEYVKGCSLVKSLIVEGCGEDYNDSNKFFNSINWSEETLKGINKNFANIELLHFTGTSSIYSLLLNFANSTVSLKHLPRIVFTNGKNYEPFREHLNQVDILALCSNIKTNDMLMNRIKKELTHETDLKSLFNVTDTENIIIHFIKLMTLLYKELNIQYQLIAVAAPLLRAGESFRIALEIFLDGHFHPVSIL